MPDPFIQSLHDWQIFYSVIGTASATLVGLMFIAVSLGADLPSIPDPTSINTFVTPMLIHFGSVVVISVVMLVPTFRLTSLGIALLVIGGICTVYSCWVGWHFIRHPRRANFSSRDGRWYVIYPLVGDGLIMFMALGLLSGSLDSLNMLAAAVVILLLVSVRNSWDLMLWVAQNRQPKRNP